MYVLPADQRSVDRNSLNTDRDRRHGRPRFGKAVPEHFTAARALKDRQVSSREKE